MRKPRVIIFAATIVAVLGLIWWAAASRSTVPDPVYAGHHLSYWFGPSGFGGSNDYSTRIALDPWLDSNAVPRLVQVLKTRDGAWHIVYNRVWLHFPAWLKQRASDPSSTSRVKFWSCSLLGDLGYAARPAIPELIHQLREGDNPNVQAAAAQTLGRIATLDDQPVVEALLAAATKDTNADVRQTAHTALVRVNPEAAAKTGFTNSVWGTRMPGSDVTRFRDDY